MTGFGRYRFCHIVAGVYTPVLAKYTKHQSPVGT